jgi:hypothetical protein
MHRPQFTLRALLVAMLAAGCFFGGIHFERERRRREEARAAEQDPIIRQREADRLRLLGMMEQLQLSEPKAVPTSQAR